MGYIDHLSEFLFDEKRRLSSKAAVVVLVTLTILIINDIFGFSYSYTVDKKIQQVQTLNSILNDSSIDDKTRRFAFNLRSEVINRKSYFHKFLSNLNNTTATNIKPKDKPSHSKNDLSHKRSNFWFAMSAGGIYFILGLLIIPLLFFADKSTSVAQRLATGIATAVSFILFGMFFVWLFGLIPKLSGSTWAWNYTLNLTIQIAIISLLGYVAMKKK